MLNNKIQTWCAETSAWILVGSTTKGLYHTVNQDTIAAAETENGGIIAVVADGVSQGACGDIASQALAKHFLELPEMNFCTDKISQWLIRSDVSVRDAVAQYDNSIGASTGVGAWLSSNGSGHVGHIGDCRAYLWQHNSESNRYEGQFTQITQDHTYRRLNEIPPYGLCADNPSRMAGTGAVEDLQAEKLQLKSNDILVLCSDGINCSIPDEMLCKWVCDISQILMKKEYEANEISTSLKNQINNWINTAVGNGSEDDVSVILVYRKGT